MKLGKLIRTILNVEQLEDRCVMAGGGIPSPLPLPVMPTVKVSTLSALSSDDIAPGALQKSIADFTIAVEPGPQSASFARMTEFLCMAADGSGDIYPTIGWTTLQADLNGDAKDGCETQIGWAYPDYTTGLLDYANIKPATWFRPKPVHVQVWANVSTSPASNKIGLEVAYATFNDLRNNEVTKVVYDGATPTIHTVETAVLGISQMQMPRAETVYVGAQNVKMFEFSVWDNHAAPTSFSFVASQGNLRNAQKYWLVHANYNQIQDTSIPGVLSADGKTLKFDVSSVSVEYGTWDVMANIATVLSANSSLQLAFSKTPATGIDTETGHSLVGLAVGGGAGQIQVYLSSTPATTYSIVRAPEAFVTEVKSLAIADTAQPGSKNLVVNAFDVRSDSTTATITHVAINAIAGDVRSFTNYVLWVDTNNDQIVDKALAIGAVSGSGTTGQVMFDFNRSFLPRRNVRFEVHADVSSQGIIGPFAQFQLAAGSVAVKRINGPVMEVFVDYEDQMIWKSPFYDLYG